MSEDIYAKPDLSKKVRFQTGEKKDEEDEEEQGRKEGICDTTENRVIYYNCWTEKSTPPKTQDNTTDDQQRTTSVSQSEDIYAKPDLSKKVRFQMSEKKEDEERGKEDVCDNTDNVVIYDNCWTERSTPPLHNTTDDQQKTTSVSQSEDTYAKPDLSKKVRFQMSEKKEDEERRNTDVYQNINNVVTVVDPGPLKRTLPRAAGVFLGLLCLVLLAAVIVLLVLWIQDQNNWNTQRKRLTEDNTYLTRERDELQTNNSLIESEKNLLMVKNNNLTAERDELQTNYSLIEREKNLLMVKNNNLTTERDELRKQLETHYCPDYWISFGRSCYLISDKNQPTTIPKKTWTDSERFCEDQGAHLVIISNEEEQKFISSFDLQVWIGLTDEETEGVWKWVDGTQVTKTYWRSGQPDNPPPGENCVVITTDVYTNNWNDLFCTRERHFICEINL